MTRSTPPLGGRRRTTSVPELVAAARAGQLRAVGRLVSLVEDDAPQLPEAMAELSAHTGTAHLIGITGPPGVGKSTSTSALVSLYRARGQRVAVLAIDPSSPFSGGALLGDRIRMDAHAGDRGVFIRSMASRGHLGGLSRATGQAARVLDAAGFDVVLIETVGVGQSEVEVASLADTTIVLLAPGMGDGIQAAKAGILEVGDLYVINKSDRDGADRLRRELRGMLTLSDRPEDSWKPPVLQTRADVGDGIDAVVDGLDAHLDWLRGSGRLAPRRTLRAREEIESIVWEALRSRLGAERGTGELDRLAADVAAGTRDAYSAAEQLVRSLHEGDRP